MWIHLLTSTILTLTTTTSQTIQIHDMTRNPGLLTLQTGNTQIKTGRHRIYHAIDLDKYEPLLDTIETAINGLNIFPDLTDLTTMMRTKFKNTKELYRRILPFKQIRQKRGALNFLGSAIKVVTGNLDESDLIQINNDINNLRLDNQELIRQNNIQVTYNKHLEQRINTIIDSVNEQQKIIKQQIIAARQSLINNRQINQNFTVIRQVFKISYHIDLITDHLNAVFEVIQLAKINVISKNFLETEEIKFILDRLEEENIPILNPDQAYDYLDIRAFFKGHTLYFIIGIPQISRRPFNHLLLEPLPINGQMIKLPWHHAAISENFTYFLKDSCQSIGENTLCDEDKLQDVSKDECFSKILRGLPGRCTFINYSNITNIKRLTDNYVVIKNSSVTLVTDCLPNGRNLSGTFVIFFSNCTIAIDGKSFNTVTFLTKPLQAIPLDGVKIEQSNLEAELNLHVLEKMHIQNREQLQIYRNRFNLQTYTSLGLSSTCIVLGSCIIVFTWYRRRSSPGKTNLTINMQRTNNHPEDNQSHLEIVSGRSNLEGKAVNNGCFHFATTSTPTTKEQLIGIINEAQP